MAAAWPATTTPAKPSTPKLGWLSPGPAARIGRRAGETAAREEDAVGAEHVPDRPMILQRIAVAHFEAGAAIGIHGVGGDIGVAVGAGAFAVIGFETANDPGALGHQIAQLGGDPSARVRVGEIQRTAVALPP